MIRVNFVVYIQQNYTKTKAEMSEDLQKALLDIDELRNLLAE